MADPAVVDALHDEHCHQCHRAKGSTPTEHVPDRGAGWKCACGWWNWLDDEPQPEPSVVDALNTLREDLRTWAQARGETEPYEFEARLALVETALADLGDGCPWCAQARAVLAGEEPT